MRREHNTHQPRNGKQNIFRAVSAGRSNILFDLIAGLLMGLASYPSFITEIFMRRKFGERYYTMATGLMIALVLMLIYFALPSSLRKSLGIVWIIFTVAFLIRSIQHRMEISKFGTAYDFSRYSYSDGIMWPFVHRLINKEIFGFRITQYRLFVLIEPAIPTFIGLFLTLIPFSRGIGVLIFISGLSFGYRNFMKAHIARQFILDIIDEKITNEGKRDVILEEKPKEETKGLSFPIELPEDLAIRGKILNEVTNRDALDVWNDEIDEELEELINNDHSSDSQTSIDL